MATAEATVDAKEQVPSRFRSIPQWIWAVTLVISTAFVVNSAISIHRVKSSASWPTAHGTVEISDLNYSPLSRTALKYQLNIAYHYRVDGKRYQSSRVSFADKTRYIGRTRGERYVKRVLAEYPKGASVTVHYHPSDPGRAVLETDISQWRFKSLLLGLGMMLLSLIGFWRRWSLQSDHLFRAYDPHTPMTVGKFVLGAVGLAACLGIAWIWWELIKTYAGR